MTSFVSTDPKIALCWFGRHARPLAERNIFQRWIVPPTDINAGLGLYGVERYCARCGYRAPAMELI